LPVAEGVAMTHEFTIRRYAAYFRGWCQAFGEHEGLTDEDTGISWLLGESQLGFILPAHLTKRLYREVLGKNRRPVLDVRGNIGRAGDVEFVLPDTGEFSAPSKIRDILETSGEGCVFLTSHFMYGTGTRIITLSDRKPLSIIYKEIGLMRIRLD
jgi:hypothetical protein